MTMSMKAHILAALREQFDGWEEPLAKLSEEEIVPPHFDLDWSIKDVVVHLWAWQQISSAPMEGGFPWLKGHNLAFILVASYAHHQEHFEKLMNWLRQPGN
jgi:hypothetical protein